MRNRCSSPSSNRTRGQRSGFALVAAALSILLLIPVVGLSIDIGVLYLVKTRLSMAVDAGALAGARALSRGLSTDQQISSAQETARAYVRANFPDHFLPNTNLTIPDPRIDVTAAHRRSVAVSANVLAPTYFMKIFGRNHTPVTALGVAVRRDVNVVVVLDRSGSLAVSRSCEAVKANAVTFVERFSEGRDYVGLVTFASSSREDFRLASNFRSANPNVAGTIQNVACTGATNTSQGLWQGYSQLVALNQPDALNVILFFTDGQPTAFTGKFKITAGRCLDTRSKTAALSFVANAANVPSSNYGLLNPIAPPQPLTSDLAIAADSSGCAYASHWPNSASQVGEDVEKLPVADIYGNRLITGYQPVAGGTVGSGPLPDTTALDEPSTAELSPSNIRSAAINAADASGLRIRNGDSVQELGRGLSGVIVFSIGLGNAAGGIEQDFMRRVSNDPEASNYDASKPAGLFLYAPQVSDLAQAFNRIASEILRLAR